MSAATPQNVEIIHAPRSLKARVLKMALFEKKVPFQETRLNIFALEDLKPLKGKVLLPDEEVLYVRDKRPIVDFSSIVADLEHAAPQPPLFPAPDKHALHDEWMKKLQALPIMQLAHEYPGTFKRLGLLATETHRLEKIREFQRRKQGNSEFLEQKKKHAVSLIKFLKEKQNSQEISRELFNFLGDLEQALVGKDYLVSYAPCLADYMCACVLHFLKESGLASLWQGGKYPRVSIFYSRFSKRPSFQQACLSPLESRETRELIVRGIVMYTLEFIGSLIRSNTRKPS